MSSQQSTTPPNKGVWVLVATLLSLLAAIVGGILTVVKGESIAAAFLYGGGAFTIALPVTIVVFKELNLL
ncbi:hypothetical protein ADK60_14045 [Streptomyces sp. XY431]|uniref:hypothetical protein n=1 Tax=Streptomyces sp. XY431 TaxID=1415562 RepID=UPI0006B02F1B|nr:hypothetical protein [Streptomyces sp. XY431]KOV32370.1 hypothetical protein ADK60_14045 [Streptomyces sp. XY431]